MTPKQTTIEIPDPMPDEMVLDLLHQEDLFDIINELRRRRCLFPDEPYRDALQYTIDKLGYEGLLPA